MNIQCFGVTATAGRDTNDDSFAVRDDLGIFAVADGIGGRPGGGVASQTAVESLLRELGSLVPADRLDPGRLRGAIAAVNDAVMAVATTQPALSGLGTTLSAVIVSDGAIRLVHLGDSRVYVVRARSIARLSHDHTVANDLVAMNRLAPEDVPRHPLRGMLSRFIGSAADADPDIVEIDAASGDWIILATDGLTSVLGDEDIRALCESSGRDDAESLCRGLVDEAMRRHPHDNVTVVALHLRG